MPAVSVDRVVDTTGAGDFWAAGFLFGDLTGKDLQTAGAYGAKLGAAVVQQMGAVIAEEDMEPPVVPPALNGADGSLKLAG